MNRVRIVDALVLVCYDEVRYLAYPGVIVNGSYQKRWEIPSPAPGHYIDNLVRHDIHPVLAQIFYSRGYTEPAQALEFLCPYSKDDNPFRLKGMEDAVYRLRLAIRNKEPIAVYGDFDADGVTATVLLTQVLRQLGAIVSPYIPDRVDEGYGLNTPALKNLAGQGVRVVVTVDCGIRSIREIEEGNRAGLDIIITDHHSVGAAVPPALSIINPKQPDCPYPEKMLAGVGLAYKLAQGLYMEAKRRGYKKGGDWRPEDWLDLVAIGTVADIVPLVGENRVLVRDGLKRLNHPERPGLKALYGVAGVKLGNVNAMSIGFFIGPRINAAGRLRSAMLSYELLQADQMSKAAQLATELNDVNQLRQRKTDEMQTWAEESIPGDPADEPILFSADPRFERGVVGLVASRLTEQYYRPSAVVQVGQEESHGSCRSIPEFHITHALEQCDDLLERYGGHAAAAGFTVSNENIEPLQERLFDIAAEELAEKELIPTLVIDTELPLQQANLELVDALARLEPTGEGNQTPLFMAQDVVIRDRHTVGTDGKHLKLAISDGTSSLEAIAFRRGDEVDTLPERVNIAYHLEVNEWNNQRRLQLNIQDIYGA
ncbi:MAG: single-stranded-DNA-specific exonuclease RecJ [Anaerolineae bacterium]|nr:single-stranded-DNA-specific exonuclease RecJ [Anaerolineae bacterium]